MGPEFRKEKKAAPVSFNVKVSDVFRKVREELQRQTGTYPSVNLIRVDESVAALVMEINKSSQDICRLYILTKEMDWPVKVHEDSFIGHITFEDKNIRFKAGKKLSEMNEFEISFSELIWPA